VRLTLLVKTVREYGVAWAFWRVLYTVALKVGYFHRGMNAAQDPLQVLVKKMGGPKEGAAAWLAKRWQMAPGSFFAPGEEITANLSAVQKDDIYQRADNVLSGRFDLFSTGEERGFPPNWFQAAAGFADWPSHQSWTKVADLSRANGDIKHLWEIGRAHV